MLPFRDTWSATWNLLYDQDLHRLYLQNHPFNLEPALERTLKMAKMGHTHNTFTATIKYYSLSLSFCS